MNDLQLATIRNLQKVCEILNIKERLNDEQLTEFRIESAKLTVKVSKLARTNEITPEFYQAFCDGIPQVGRAALLMSFIGALKDYSDSYE